MRRSIDSGSSHESYNSMFASRISRQLGSSLYRADRPKHNNGTGHQQVPLSLVASANHPPELRADEIECPSHVDVLRKRPVVIGHVSYKFFTRLLVMYASSVDGPIQLSKPSYGLV